MEGNSNSMICNGILFKKDSNESLGYWERIETKKETFEENRETFSITIIDIYSWQVVGLPLLDLEQIQQTRDSDGRRLFRGGNFWRGRARFVFVVLERAGANLRGHDRNRHPAAPWCRHVDRNRTRLNKNAHVTEAKFHDTLFRARLIFTARWNFNLATLVNAIPPTWIESFPLR